MAKLIAKYIMEIYDDGTVRQIRIDQEEKKQRDDVLDLNETSERTAQILDTIKNLVEIFDKHNFEEEGDFEIRPALQKAIEMTAERFNRKIQSVIDKLTRQIGEDMYSLRDHLSEFLQVYADGTLKEEKVQNNLKIKQIMVATIKDRGGKKDALMIYRYFKNPEFEFIYK